MGDAPAKPRRRKISHRVFVPPSRIDKDGKKISALLDPDTVHHLRTVLRLSAGSRLAIFDNSGTEYEGKIVELTPRRGVVEVESYSRPAVESPLRITLAQSLIKGNGFDRMLADCTEVGAAGFIPLFTARTVVKISKADAADRVRRWERILAESAAQCGRVVVPKMAMPLDLDELLAKPAEGLRIILYERGGRGQLEEIVKDADLTLPVTLLAGPEGGFEEQEVERAIAAGFKVLGLGPRILRAETIGPVAVAVLQHALGDM